MKATKLCWATIESVDGIIPVIKYLSKALKQCAVVWRSFTQSAENKKDRRLCTNGDILEFLCNHYGRLLRLKTKVMLKGIVECTYCQCWCSNSKEKAAQRKEVRHLAAPCHLKQELLRWITDHHSGLCSNASPRWSVVRDCPPLKS